MVAIRVVTGDMDDVDSQRWRASQSLARLLAFFM
jgi:hypothetical protein